MNRRRLAAQIGADATTECPHSSTTLAKGPEPTTTLLHVLADPKPRILQQKIDHEVDGHPHFRSSINEWPLRTIVEQIRRMRAYVSVDCTSMLRRATTFMPKAINYEGLDELNRIFVAVGIRSTDHFVMKFSLRDGSEMLCRVLLI
jgi:hypothetical protein